MPNIRHPSMVVLVVAAFLALHDLRAIETVSSSPEDVCPALNGTAVPKISAIAPDGKRVDLNDAIAKKNTILIFYRGGWCPFCTTHLSQVQEIVPELAGLGFQIFAISPDRPDLLKPAAEKADLTYNLLSDSDMAVARALGIAFRLDDALVKKYKEDYKIDIEADSGHTHHQLPVPSAFVVGTDGMIRFSFVNPDYKIRIDGQVLLAAARVVSGESSMP